MEKLFKQLAQKYGVGNTPLTKFPCTDANIFVKEEQYNASGSVKARPALAMILQGVTSGKLQQGGTIIEATSGNTGIALAHLGKQMGYNVVLTMPETMSVERRNMLKNLGAEVILTSGLGMQPSIDKAIELENTMDNAVYVRQFCNMANRYAHEISTAVEIASQLNGTIPDCFVASVGTGGTICGVGKVLKSLYPNIKIIAVEPSESAVLSGNKVGAHKIQGIGAGFVPQIVDTSLIDSVVTVTSSNALEFAHKLNTEYNFGVGYSSGANLFVATQLAQKEYKNKTIVTVFPDSNDRYGDLKN